TVVALDHAARVLRVYPEVVIVAVGNGNVVEGLAAVMRAEELDVEHPDGLRILWVGDDVHVVPGTLAQLALLAKPLPGGAAVVGLDDGVDAAGARGGGTDADLAKDAFGQSLVVREVGPGVAAVGGLPEATAFATALQLVGAAPGAPAGSVEDARVIGVHG